MTRLPNLPPISVLAFDPGITTGLVYVEKGQLKFACSLSRSEMRERCAEDLFSYCKTWAVENFFLYPSERYNLRFSDFPAVRVIGNLEIAAIRVKATIILETASAAKNFATNAKLQQHGWWPMLEDAHQRDAARHALLFLYKRIKRGGLRLTAR